MEQSGTMPMTQNAAEAKHQHPGSIGLMLERNTAAAAAVDAVMAVESGIEARAEAAAELCLLVAGVGREAPRCAKWWQDATAAREEQEVDTKLRLRLVRQTFLH